MAEELCSDSAVDKLENRVFPKASGEDIKNKLVEFSDFFNGTCRNYFLTCGQKEKAEFIHLLLTLKHNVNAAIPTLNRSNRYTPQCLTCSVCKGTIQVKHDEDVLDILDQHLHMDYPNDSESMSFEEESPSTSTSRAAEEESIEASEAATAGDYLDVSDSPPEQESAHASVADDIQEPGCSTASGLNDFKFNFVVQYDPAVESSFYPKSIMSAAQKLDAVTDFTIQRISNHSAQCLLCSCSLKGQGKVSPFHVKNHVSGQKHMKCSSNPMALSVLKKYHEFWKRQETNYQAHQTFFLPEHTSVVIAKCIMCQEFVSYNNVISHIRGAVHKKGVVKMSESMDGKPSAPLLLHLQVKVYGIEPALNEQNGTQNSSEPQAAEEPEEGKIVRRRIAAISKSFMKLLRRLRITGSLYRYYCSTDNPSDYQMLAANYKGNIKGPKCAITKATYEFSPQIILPERYRAHWKFFVKTTDQWINCKLCQFNFKPDMESFRAHIGNPQHRQLVKPKHFDFYCEICDTRFKDEELFYAHLKAPKVHDKLSEGRRNRLAEYECKTCSITIFGDMLSLNRHILSASKGMRKKKEITLPFNVIRLFKTTELLESEADRLLDEARQTSQCQEKLKVCCDDLEKSLAKLFPNAKSYPFGSRVSGLGNMKSDLDIFMDVTGDMYTGLQNQDFKTQEQIVKNVGKILKSCREEFSCIVNIPAARTPIVKLHHCYTDLDCDMSFRHGLGVENTKFLRFCMELQPITQTLILLLRKWSEHCKLNEHVTNYSLAVMTIFYLQTKGLLLTVKKLRSFSNVPPIQIDGWDTISYTVPMEKMRESIPVYQGSVKPLLIEFFQYFSEFSYEKQVICPLLGQTVPKSLFGEPPTGINLPIEMAAYMRRVQEDESDVFRSLAPFCVQDPFDLSHNLTKGCQQGTIVKLKTLCKLTYDFLSTLK